MVSARNKKQSSGRRFSQLDDFDQDNYIGNTVNYRQENATVSECTGAQELTVDISDNKLMAYENTVNVKTLERCFNEGIDKK